MLPPFIGLVAMSLVLLEYPFASALLHADHAPTSQSIFTEKPPKVNFNILCFSVLLFSSTESNVFFWGRGGGASDTFYHIKHTFSMYNGSMGTDDPKSTIYVSQLPIVLEWVNNAYALEKYLNLVTQRSSDVEILPGNYFFLIICNNKSSWVALSNHKLFLRVSYPFFFLSSQDILHHRWEDMLWPALSWKRYRWSQVCSSLPKDPRNNQQELPR